ncbi:MAG TPA: YdcF family protein [Candidatus Limnocylindrales bacterium]|nr:YdcF family protein [Candidatus Limnocylindrales bacterium]
MRWLKRGLYGAGIIVLLWLLFAAGLGAVVFSNSRVDNAEPSDVIVVLGSGLRRDNSPGPSLYRRTSKAAELYQQGIAPNIICTGGFAAGHTRSEASACAELLIGYGVPAQAITLEERSRSTLENAAYTREIMDADGWQTAVVVSDGYHLLRAGWIFQQAGINAVTSPADTDPPAYSLLVSVAREVAALHLQALITLFNLPITYVPAF